MIQDIKPQRLWNTYEHKIPDRDALMLVFRENDILMREGETAGFLTFEEVKEWCEKQRKKMPHMVYLFSIGADHYFLTELSCVPDGFHYVRMFKIRRMKPIERIFAAATAWHLYVWYRDNQFCGRCSFKLKHSETLRMLSCPSCGNLVYPKIAPAVIVGVTDGERILMTKYADREYKKYALIAGFTEIGETAEETVKREVMEEVGLHVKNICYYKSQPWGFDGNLLLGYYCELNGSSEIRLEEEELEAAEWINYRDIPDDAEGISLTGEMMVHFREERQKEL